METKRRSRFKARPTGVGRHGERVSGTPNQLAILKALQTGPLPSIYLRKVIKSETSAADVILLLSQEGFIEVPQEARMHYSLFGRPVVYQLSKKGIEFLTLDNPSFEVSKHGNGQYRHSLMASVVGHFFMSAPRFIPGLTVIQTKKNTEEVSPDWQPFGFEYQGNKIFLHGFEADRGTEPLRGNDRETIETKVINYTRYLSRIQRDNVYVPFITMSERRAHNIKGVVSDLAGDEAKHFIVSHMDDFIHDRFPELDGGMVTRDWLTTTGTFNIMEQLHGSPRESTEGRRDIGANQEARS